MNENTNAMVSLYVVRGASGTYFAGFDTAQNKANFVTDPKEGKKFTNKFDVKLRPDETLVELSVDLSKVEVAVSEPFRPHRKVKQS